MKNEGLNDCEIIIIIHRCSKTCQSFKVCQSVVFKVPFTQVGIIVLKFQTCYYGGRLQQRYRVEVRLRRQKKITCTCADQVTSRD